MPNGTVYREASGYSVVNKAGAKFRVYSPVGALLGVVLWSGAGASLGKVQISTIEVESALVSQSRSTA